MALERRSSEILHFATFEVDLRAGELRKQGKRVRLQKQPFQVLAALLQRPGEVVTREELRKQIWPEDTFVDFDNSLNTAVNKVREALSDSADIPRFVETLQRRGYRFLAPINAAAHGATQINFSARKATPIGLAVALVVVVGVAVFLRQAGRRPVLTEKDIIVVGDFTNSTGDPVFDGTLREGLSVQLQQSPFLSLVSEEGIHQTLRMMGQPVNARLTPEITREICQRTSSRAALSGSIALIGSKYQLILKAVNCADANLLASVETQAADKSQVLDALSGTASEMRQKLGESLSTLQEFNTPLKQATTPSLEALQAYNLAWNGFYEDFDAAGSLPFAQRAVQIDPNFAMAHWALGNAYGGIGKSALSAREFRKAFDLRASASEWEKLIIESDYYSQSGDVMKYLQSNQVGEQLYPREIMFHLNLNDAFNAIGQYEAGLRESQEALRLEPSSSYSWRKLVHSYVFLNRVDEATTAARKAQAKGVDTLLTDVLYEIAFYRNDAAEMARQAARAAGKPADEELVFAKEADTAAYFGRLEKAAELSRRAADAAERAGAEETGGAPGIYAVSALREALFGNTAKAYQTVSLAKQQAGKRETSDLIVAQNDYAIALALAYAGEVPRAEALAAGLNQRFPEDTVMQVNYLPALRGKLAVLHGNPQEALEIVKAAAPYELGLPAFGFYNWPNLYPVYVRGEAYLAAHQGKEAAAEFQKILDHKGIVFNEPIGALARLQLGRAYALEGDMAKTRAAYQDFFTLWKDADTDIPILQQAKSEYAKLQ
jgi:DNA-binding winged helix-turn-helix (wHTH) protein